MKPKFYISTYQNFYSIPNDILCIGVSKEIPKEFRKTTILNFLYTPNSILGATFPKDKNISEEEYINAYKKHLEECIVKMKNNKLTTDFSSLKQYFSIMYNQLVSMNDDGFKGVCFLDYSLNEETDTCNILKSILKELNFNVDFYSSISLTNTLF